MDEYEPMDEGEVGTRDAVTRLRDLVRGIRVAMMVTVDGEGRLHSRPMATLEVGDDGSVWFLTATHTAKVADVLRDARVHLTYARPTTERYVALSGRAETVDDSARIRRLWSPIFRTWFPKGPEDTDLTLVRVHVDEVESWDRPGGTVRAAIDALMAMTGARPESEERGHERFRVTITSGPAPATTRESDVRTAPERVAQVLGTVAHAVQPETATPRTTGPARPAPAAETPVKVKVQAKTTTPTAKPPTAKTTTPTAKPPTAKTTTPTAKTTAKTTPTAKTTKTPTMAKTTPTAKPPTAKTATSTKKPRAKAKV